MIRWALLDEFTRNEEGEEEDAEMKGIRDFKDMIIAFKLKLK